MNSDWRLTNQINYLNNKKLQYIQYKAQSTFEHSHCEFCWKKFMEHCIDMEDCTEEGYSTLDGEKWICKQCYEDFKELFKWKIE